MSAAYNHDDDRDHPQAMIDWLARQTPDVWHEVAPNLNWDNAERVLEWIVTQPQCDRATAALVFWSASPLYYMHAMATGEWRSDDGLRIVTTILRNWKTGFYARAELAWREDHRADYAAARASLGGSDPLAIPADLVAPLKGRKPNVPEALLPENNLELYELYYALGTDMGRKPGTDWKAAELRRQRAAVLANAADTGRFYLKAAPWLLAFGVVMIGGAIILRYLHKGVWL